MVLDPDGILFRIGKSQVKNTDPVSQFSSKDVLCVSDKLMSLPSLKGRPVTFTFPQLESDKAMNRLMERLTLICSSLTVTVPKTVQYKWVTYLLHNAYPYMTSLVLLRSCSCVL